MGRHPLQVILVALVAAVCIYVVFKVAVGWADWVVLAMILVTAFGAAVAIYPRQYPTRKRAYTRHSDDKFRRR
jgi:cytochrome bd-type quinol oxidase subunit 2